MTEDRNDTRKRLTEVAAEHGLAVGTWSPGDGATRYRFIDSYDAAGNITVHPGELDYFGANGDRMMYTALGLTEAWVWLRGYISASNTAVRHAYIQREAARRAVNAA